MRDRIAMNVFGKPDKVPVMYNGIVYESKYALAKELYKLGKCKTMKCMVKSVFRVTSGERKTLYGHSIVEVNKDEE